MASNARDTPTQNRLDVAVLLHDLGYIKNRLDQMCTRCLAHDTRLRKVERLTWAGGSLVGLISAILIPIAVAAIKKWFGL